MNDVSIKELLDRKSRPLLSFEFFPPRDDQGLESLKKAAARLLSARPDFVTVTYGAGGSTRDRSLQVCELLRSTGFSPVMPHLTCVGSSRAEIRELAGHIHGLGFRNIMSLRGDPPEGETVFRPAQDGLAHAADLVRMLKSAHPDFCCGVGGYPEVHPEAASPEADIECLREKMDAGADFIATQLFFDNRFYFAFVNRCRQAGIRHPILPGLLPALSLGQAQRMTSRCKTALPDALVRQMEGLGNEAAEEVGIRWAVDQIDDLLSKGAPGIHLYVLNRSKVALSPLLTDCLRRFRG